MFIAMNNFKVVAGQEAIFEQRWRERQSHLGAVPGFVQFALLKGDTPGEFISHTTWESREAFMDWTTSENFTAGHRQGGSMQGVLETHPQVGLYEAVIVERPG